MITLRYKYNAVFKSVCEASAANHEYLPVLTRTGDFERIKWLGFIDLDDAQKINGAVPVKLDIHQYSTSVGLMPKWRHMREDMAVQGCLTILGVYAVADDGRPRMVKKPAPS
jgi:hypothetical protein